MLAFNAIAGLASVAGLIFSWLAFVHAKSAATAATEARNAIVLREIAEVIESASQRADQLFDLIRHARYPEASMRVGDLLPVMAELQHRRSSHFQPNDTESLRLVHVQLVTLRDRLRHFIGISFVPTACSTGSRPLGLPFMASRPRATNGDCVGAAFGG